MTVKINYLKTTGKRLMQLVLFVNEKFGTNNIKNIFQNLNSLHQRFVEYDLKKLFIFTNKDSSYINW